MSTTAIVAIAMDDMQKMANAIAKSGLFGIKTADQCLALMLIAHAEGKHPAIVARDYDVIQGRPAKKSEAMLRDFLEAGGKVQWHAMTDELADATFSHPQGGEVRINWDLARAKRAGLTGKDNYQKYSRQMLASRTISEGCRRVYPACTSGLYEPGEVRQIAKEEKDMGKAEVVKEEDWTTGITTESAAPQGTASEVRAGSSEGLKPNAPVAAAPITRSETFKRMCEEVGLNAIDMLAKSQVRSAEELSEDDWRSFTAMHAKRKLRLEAATQA